MLERAYKYGLKPGLRKRGSEIFKKMKAMDESGYSFEEIKKYVTEEMEKEKKKWKTFLKAEKD